MSAFGRLQRWLLRRLAPRVAAAALCLPLVAGSALGPLVDAIIYPHGACCCERAHGRPHHCHCAEPPASADGNQANCGSVQWNDGDDEYGPPSPWAMPAGVLSGPLETETAFYVPVRFDAAASTLRSFLRVAPPTPPPIGFAGV